MTKQAVATPRLGVDSDDRVKMRSTHTGDFHHTFKNGLERHRMTAASAGLKKITVAMPFAFVISYSMVIVFTFTSAYRLAFSILPINP